MLPNPMPYFEGLKDPRRETKNKLHKLSDIIMIALCAVLSGIEDWVGMEEFAEEKEAWLRGFLQLPNGIPSHDTLSDVLGRIDPSAFAEAFTRWVQAALPTLSGQQVCLDGKTLRGSRDGDKAVHLMSAFAAQARWVLTQQQKPEWAGLQAVGRVESTRIIDGKTSVENRYYLCSFTDLTRFAEGVRQHWSIENQQHWVLDVQFGEDAHRARKVKCATFGKTESTFSLFFGNHCRRWTRGEHRFAFLIALLR